MEIEKDKSHKQENREYSMLVLTNPSHQMTIATVES